jgi:hypothetical protein
MTLPAEDGGTPGTYVESKYHRRAYEAQFQSESDRAHEPVVSAID